MNSTGPIESWIINPIEVGPMYPFAGWEMALTAVCVAFYVAFMVWKFASENTKYTEQVRRLQASDELAKAVGIDSQDPMK